MFKIALSAGHGYNTPGKRCLKKYDKNQTREWVLNDRICDKIENKLKDYTGYSLLRVDDTTGKNNISLTNRSNASNKWGADFYLAVHHNAGVNGGKGGGIVAYTYTKASDTSKKWQKDLYTELIKATGLKGNRSTPMAAANLHECREPNAPAVLLELGFMDSATDVPIILTEKYAEQCADAIVKVIVNNGKLTKKKTAVKETTANKTTKKKSDTEIAKEVILGKWGNGVTRKTKLKKAGYDPDKIQAIVNKLLK